MYLIKYLPVLIFLILVCTGKSLCNNIDCHPLCEITVWWRAGVCQQNGRCLCRWGWTGPRAVYVNVGKLKNFILADYCIYPCHFTHDYRNPKCGVTSKPSSITTSATSKISSPRTSVATTSAVTATSLTRTSVATTSAVTATSSTSPSVATTSAVTATSLTRTAVATTSLVTGTKITTQNATTKIILTITPKVSEIPTETTAVVKPASSSSSATTLASIPQTAIPVTTITPSKTSSQATSPKTTSTVITTNLPTTASPSIPTEGPDIN